MSHEPIAYTYEADYHCPDCARDRFGYDSNGFITGEDNEGNEIGVIAPWDEVLETMVCGTCGDIIVEVETDDNEENRAPDDDEPDEDSITTEDNIHFYQYGKLALTVDPRTSRNKAISHFMQEQMFWPNTFVISDHGNACLIEYWKED